MIKDEMIRGERHESIWSEGDERFEKETNEGEFIDDRFDQISEGYGEMDGGEKREK